MDSSNESLRKENPEEFPLEGCPRCNNTSVVRGHCVMCDWESMDKVFRDIKLLVE